MMIRFNTSLGMIEIKRNENALTELNFSNEKKEINTEDKLLQKAKKQMLEYASGKRKEFSLPLAPEGSDFQKRAWDYLLTIPYGETKSYKDQAISMASPKASRAVGGANSKNPLPILIPCHRIIKSDGSIHGYNGGAKLKRKLLEIEKKS